MSRFGFIFFFSSRRRHTRCSRDWSSDVCSSDLIAVLAKENKVPFYIAAPISTFDLSIADGEHIPIEERSAAEVTHLQGVRIAPDVPAANPAFDVTPARYIAAIFTERGVARRPFTESLRALAQQAPQQHVASPA